MVEAIEKMLCDLECNKLTRRQFAISVAKMAAVSATPALLTARAEAASFRAVSLNHITMRVPDLQRTSRFYQEFFGMPIRQHSSKIHILGVGPSFFGIEQGEGPTATLDHFDFGIANFNADALRARLSELHLNFSDAKSQESFKFYDPDGFQVQVNRPDYIGSVT